MSFYEDALKIFAICIDNSISETDARVLTYIHSKIIEKGNNYFLSPPKEEELAITIMLGVNIMNLLFLNMTLTLEHYDYSIKLQKKFKKLIFNYIKEWASKTVYIANFVADY